MAEIESDLEVSGAIRMIESSGNGWPATGLWSSGMSPQNQVYTVLVAPSSYAGLVTARTSDGGNFRSRQPLLDGARYWAPRNADPAATIITAWSSGNGEWALRATIGRAAKLTVRDNRRGTPTFRQYEAWPHGSRNG